MPRGIGYTGKIKYATYPATPKRPKKNIKSLPNNNKLAKAPQAPQFVKGGPKAKILKPKY